MLVDGVASEPWKKAFRWRIPHLPPGDSVEFTFQSVDATSSDYEVALYNSDLAIVEKVVGEPAPKVKRFSAHSVVLLASLIGVLVSVIVALWGGVLNSPGGEKFSRVSQAAANYGSFLSMIATAMICGVRGESNIGCSMLVTTSAYCNPRSLTPKDCLRFKQESFLIGNG
jgi:hypothetical protein